MSSNLTSKQRNPAIELYRVMLMFGIVSLHTLCGAGLGFSPMARWVMFCVDGFVFISGWYGIKFGWKKVVKLYGLSLWCAMLTVLARWFVSADESWTAMKFLSSVARTLGGYWFINAYVVLMCFAPIVNAALESQRSRMIFLPIVIAIFGWSFVCSVPVVGSWIPATTGFGSHSFFTLLGVYIVARIARLDHWNERFSTKQLVLALVVLSVFGAFNLHKYNSPVAVLTGGVLFMIFDRFDLSRIPGGGMLSAFIMLISPSMLAVYLLHGGHFNLTRQMLSHFGDGWVGYLIVAPSIFAICLLIDLLRRAVFYIFARLRLAKPMLLSTLVLTMPAWSMSVPEWLPNEYRFEVDGDSNAINQVVSTLTAMRNGIAPDIKKYVDENDLLGPYLQWVVRWCRPGITNEAQYLSAKAHPESFTLSDFDRMRLTNAVAKIRYVPPTVKLSLVYDDKNRAAVTRAIPGVDYPGVEFEDAGTTPHDVRLTLRAPKLDRHFRLRVTATPYWGRQMEFKWIVLKGYASAPGWERRDINPESELQDVHARQDSFKNGPAVLAVVAREKGRIWGPPSFVHLDADKLCKHTYFKGNIFSIDYGEYCDTYNLDGKGRILGFDRVRKSTLEKECYSNKGSLVLETYPNDAPKVIREVKYFLKDGKLGYEVKDGAKNLKMEPVQFRSDKW